METSIDDPFPPAFLGILLEIPSSSLISFVLFLIILLALSGIVSGSEVAFFSLRFEDLQNDGKKSSNRIRKLLSTPKELLATILILNNLINVFIITLSTYVTWLIVDDKESMAVAIAVLTTTITFLIIFFGEIIPKVVASKNSLKFAHFISGFILFFVSFLKPISWFLITMSQIIEKRIQKKGYSLSVDDLNKALEITSETNVSDEERGMLKGIMNFGTLSVKQIMRSRMDITAIEMKSNFHELMDQINKTGYSRIPVYEDTIDKIEGILYIKDVLPHLNQEEEFKWQTLLRPGFFVPESKKIDDLFKDFQEKYVHMAIVVDEYGGTEGLVTLEDVIEEIVGEINDEFDDSETNYKKIDTSTFIFEGKTSLNDFCKVVDDDVSIFDDVKGESESIGGLLLEIYQKLPNAGEKIKYGKYLFTIVAVDPRRIKRVRVFREH